MKRSFRRVAALTTVLLCALVALSWSGIWSHFLSPPPTQGNWIVRIDENTYDQKALEVFLGRRALFANRQEARLAVDRFVDRALLIRETERRSRKDQPASEYETIVQMARELGASAAVTDIDIENAYEASRDLYVHPLQVTFSYLGVPRTGDDENDRQAIATLRTRTWNNRRQRGIQNVVSGNDQPAGLLYGTVGQLSCDATSTKASVARELIQTACGSSVGEVSEPIDTDNAIFVVVKTGELAARDTPLDRVKQEIRARLETQRWEKARDAVLKELRGRAHIDISDATLTGLVRRATMSTERGANGPPQRPQGGSES